MLDVYQQECGLWIVTYQRNERSEIIVHYEGDSEEEAFRIFDEVIEMWG